MSSKKTIMQLTNELIQSLHSCADKIFVAAVLECIQDGVEFTEDEIREAE